MRIYLDVVMVLNFLVDLLLLLGTNRLSGHPLAVGRAALAAGLGGAYSGACLLPGFRFLGNALWRTVSLALMAAIAFGIRASALRRGVLFLLLCTALGGIAIGMGSGSFWGLVASAGVLCLLCVIGFRVPPGTRNLIPIALYHGDRRVKLLALQDTGNTLRDPVTGQSVLVAGPEAARELLGLTQKQLASPVETMTTADIPGLRLIPYRAVGSANGMLLAVRLEHVRIGAWRGSALVAFAPEGLDRENTYQALTGGVL